MQSSTKSRPRRASNSGPRPALQAMTPARYALLGAALVAISLSAPLIRFAAAPAVAVVLWRIMLGWPFVATAAVVRSEAWPWRRGLQSGLFLAIHWGAWVTAVQMTSIASAAVLICTGALWAAALSRPLLGEPVPRSQWLGLGLALLGVTAVLCSKDAGRHTLAGDLMALLGSFAWVGYLFVGRRARQSAGFWAYTATMHLSAAACVLAVALVMDARLFGFDVVTWVALAALALFPTFVGHGGMNYLLRFENPARLSLWTLTEPVIAALLGWLCFGEVPSLQVAAGGILAIVGVAVGTRPPSSMGRGIALEGNVTRQGTDSAA